MDRVQLKNFVLLAQMLNFSAVAKQEFISQPALTKQINRLEEELGVKLFHRTKHEVSLTFAGEEFYRHAVIILDGVEKAVHHMENIRRGQTGSLSLSTVFGLDDEVSRFVSRFVGDYPEINVGILSGTASQQIQAINQQSSDIFFSFAQLLKLYPSLETLPLSDDCFAVYAHERDAAKIETQGFSYLDQLTNLVEYRSEGGPLFTGLILTLREALGLRSENVAYYATNSTVLLAVQSGMGFAFLPTQIDFGLCPPGVVRFPLDLPEARIQRAMGWPRNARNPSTLRFVETVRQLLEETAP